MRSFIAFVAGAIIGGIVAYIYADKKKTAEFEQELENYKKHYKKCECGEECFCKKEEKHESSNEDNDEIPKEVIEKVKEMQKSIRKQKINYNKIIDEKGYDTMHAEIKPYKISPDDYFNLGSNNFPNYDRIELYFDPDDNELFDENGEFIEDADEMVGMGNLSDLVERVSTEVYICNPEREALYNVCIDKS